MVCKTYFRHQGRAQKWKQSLLIGIKCCNGNVCKATLQLLVYVEDLKIIARKSFIG